MLHLLSSFSSHHSTKWALALSMALATSVTTAQNIDTVLNWNGTTSISSFGVPDTATYGQTITAPDQLAKLQSFEIRLNPQGTAFPFKFYVYEWDPVALHATGPQLYASTVQTTEEVSEFQTYGVSGLNVLLLPGKQYVLFASVSETQGPIAASTWGSVEGGSYADGGFVFLNNSAQPEQWATEPWTINWNGGVDLAFKADLSLVSLPAAPTLTVSSVGDGQESFGLSLSDSGSSPLQQYRIRCDAQAGSVGVEASGANSPLTVTGLTNGTAYDCAATATNTDGLTGPESNVVSVMPKAPPVAPKPVPTLSQWGVLLVSGLLAVMGMVGVAGKGRRRV